MRSLSLDDVVPLHVADLPFPTFPPGHPLAHLTGKVGTVMAFAVVQPNGIVLFETGIGRRHFPTISSTYGEQLVNHYKMVERPIETELERHGFAPADVRAIVNSHLHFDHCGSNPLFPGVPIYVQAAEHEAARQGGRNYTVPEWVDFPGAEFVVIDGDASVARGVKVLSTPGHTPGHQSLVVETREGRAVLAGQAIYVKEEYDEIVGGGSGYGGSGDPDQTLASSRRIIDERPTRVHFSHDQAVWTDGSSPE